MYRPVGALIVHPHRICMRADVRADLGQKTQQRAAREGIAEHRRPAAIYALTGVRCVVVSHVSLRAFRELRPLPRGLAVTKGNLIRLSSETRITRERETRGEGEFKYAEL